MTVPICPACRIIVLKEAFKKFAKIDAFPGVLYTVLYSNYAYEI